MKKREREREKYSAGTRFLSYQDRKEVILDLLYWQIEGEKKEAGGEENEKLRSMGRERALEE